MGEFELLAKVRERLPPPGHAVGQPISQQHGGVAKSVVL